MLWGCFGGALGLLSGYSADALGLLWRCSGVTVDVRSRCSEDALKVALKLFRG